MIYDVSQLVKADLARRKFPYRVFYGPERTTRDGQQPAIVFERDREADEAIEAAPGWKPLQPNENAVGKLSAPYQRWVAGTVVVYARSPRVGARSNEHEDECDLVCNGVLTALRRVCVAGRHEVVIAGEQFLTAQDFNDCEQWPGAAKRIRFTVSELIRETDYTGALPAAAVVDSVDTTVEAELAQGD